MWKEMNNIWYCDRKKRYSEKYHDFDGYHDLISPNHGKHPSESSGTWLMHLSESPQNDVLLIFKSYKQQEFLLLPNLYLVFTKLILHHPGAVTAASHGSTIADLALRTTRQPEPCILWSLFTHTLPCLTLITTVWTLVCATAPPVRSLAKASAILNESVTAVTTSRFSPVICRASNIYHNHQKNFLVNFLFIFQFRTLKNHCKHYHVHNFSWIISKWGKDINGQRFQTSSIMDVLPH